MWKHGFLSGTVTCRAFQPLSAVFGVVGRALVNVRWRGSQHRRYATHCASAVRLSRFGHHLEGPQVWPFFPTWPSCKAEGLALVLGGRESRACTEGSATLSPSLCSFVARGVLDLTLGFSRSTCLYFQDFSVWLIMIIWLYIYIYNMMIVPAFLPCLFFSWSCLQARLWRHGLGSFSSCLRWTNRNQGCDAEPCCHRQVHATESTWKSTSRVP